MKTLALTTILAIFAFPFLVSGAENSTDGKKPHTGPTNPNADISVKPKEPSKKITQTIYNDNGKIKAKTVCTGKVGQENCPAAPQ